MNYKRAKILLSIYLKKLQRKFTYVDYAKSCLSLHHIENDRDEVEVSSIKNTKLIPELTIKKNYSYVKKKACVAEARGWFYDTKFNVILDDKRRVIRNSINTSIVLKKYRKSKRKRPEEATIYGASTILRTQSSDFYHTMIDNLPRLFLLEKFLGTHTGGVKLLIPEPISSVEKAWLEALLPEGVDVVLLKQRESMVKIDHLYYVVPFTRRFVGALPMHYVRSFRKKAYSHFDCEPDRTRRIFISRVPSAERDRRCILNEDEIMEKLEPLGFERYVLERLEIREQIRLFRSAEIVVGVHGAGLSNLIFSENAAVVELFPCDFMVPHYYYLSKSVGLEYYCLFSNEKHRDATNFVVNVSALEKIVMGYLAKTETGN